MIVCSCKGVSDREIHGAIDQGSRTVRELVAHSRGAGTDCGSCTRSLRRLLQESAATSEDAVADAHDGAHD